MATFFVCFIGLFFISPVISSNCPDLNRLAATLPYLVDSNAKCETDEDCSELTCNVITTNATSLVSLAVNSCDTDKPSILISADIPNVSIRGWNAMFEDQSEQIIPGYRISDSKYQGYLLVGLKKCRNSSVSLSLTVRGCKDGSQCPINKEIVSNFVLPCSRRRFCSISSLGDCSDLEICRQIDATSLRGECVCFGNLTRSLGEGTCHAPANDSRPHNGTSPTDPSSDGAGSSSGPSVVAILVPMALLTLLAVVVVVAYRRGLLRRLGDRLQPFGRIRRTSHFEQMSIGPYDDDDLPLP